MQSKLLTNIPGLGEVHCRLVLGVSEHFESSDFCPFFYLKSGGRSRYICKEGEKKASVCFCNERYGYKCEEFPRETGETASVSPTVFPLQIHRKDTDGCEVENYHLY